MPVGGGGGRWHHGLKLPPTDAEGNKSNDGAIIGEADRNAPLMDAPFSRTHKSPIPTANMGVTHALGGLTERPMFKQVS